jgi:3-hydroxyisobutyrate dehydrogenase-like beta-hydroxyacid dehydrogenase
MRIGFLGLGQMGAAIAQHLVGKGHDLAVWNRSADKARPFAERGAAVAASPRDAAARSDVVFTMLADDAALKAVVMGKDGLAAGLAKNAVHVSLSTIAVATGDELADLHAHNGQRFISAPVFGRPDVAAAGALSIVVGGDPACLDELRPVFALFGKRVFHIGARPSSANLVKLCGNFAILSAVETMGEAMALAEKGGVPKAKVLEVMTGTLFDAPVYRNYGAMLVEDRYRPAGFAAPLGLKDMRLVGQAAETNRVAMPFLSVLRDHLLETIAKEGEDIDWAAIGLTIAKNSGIG